MQNTIICIRLGTNGLANAWRYENNQIYFAEGILDELPESKQLCCGQQFTKNATENISGHA